MPRDVPPGATPTWLPDTHAPAHKHVPAAGAGTACLGTSPAAHHATADPHNPPTSITYQPGTSGANPADVKHSYEGESSEDRSPLWRSAYGPPCPFEMDSVTSSPSLGGQFPPFSDAVRHAGRTSIPNFAPPSGPLAPCAPSAQKQSLQPSPLPWTSAGAPAGDAETGSRPRSRDGKSGSPGDQNNDGPRNGDGKVAGAARQGAGAKRGKLQEYFSKAPTTDIHKPMGVNKAEKQGAQLGPNKDGTEGMKDTPKPVAGASTPTAGVTSNGNRPGVLNASKDQKGEAAAVSPRDVDRAVEDASVIVTDVSTTSPSAALEAPVGLLADDARLEGALEAPRSRKKLRVMANARAGKGGSAGGLSLRWAHPKDSAAIRVREGATQPKPVWGASATPWGDSRILYYGGSDEDNAVVPQMFCLDTGKDTWTWEPLPAESGHHGAPPEGRAWHTATLVNDLLLVFGGEKNAAPPAQGGADDDDDGTARVFLNDIAVYDTIGRVWLPMDRSSTSGVPPCPRSGHSVTSLPKGGLLVFGGVVQSGKWHNDVYVFDTHLYNWYKPMVRGTAPQARAYHSATLVRNMIVVFGGNGGKKCFKEVHVLDTDTYTWFEPPTLTSAQASPAARTGHSAVLAPDGRHVIIYGGWDYSNAYDRAKVFNDVWALDTESWQWHEVKMEGTAPEARCGHGISLVKTSEGKHAAVIMGGQLLGEIKSNSVHAILFDE
eukprot:jgi/Mesvir1/29294/Mv01557-RA.2